MQGTLPDSPSRTYKILSRKPGQPNYLWGDASWTRHYRALSDLQMFALENIGGKIQVPHMVFEGSVDGPCVAFPEKWMWHYCYSGPTLGEGEGLPHPEE